MSIFSKRFRSSLPTGRGFTLIELLIVISVMTLLTGIFLFQQQRFDSSTLLRSLSYSVALSVRQAQIYGTSVREFGGQFDRNYGVYFSANGASAKSYTLFADVNENGQFDSNEEVRTFTLGAKFYISDFCVTQGSTDYCKSTGQIDWLTVYFVRPNPDAYFETEDGSNYSEAYIQLSGSGGDTRRISVTLTGQISVGGVGS